MNNYTELIKDILSNGEDVSNRTSQKTRRVNFRTLEFDMSNGFPLYTGKPLSFKNIAHELLWFFKGIPNIKYLIDNGVGIWSSDALRYNIDSPTKSVPQDFSNTFNVGKVAYVKKMAKLGDYRPYREFIKKYEEYVKANPNLGSVGNSYPIWWHRYIKELHISHLTPENRRNVFVSWNDKSVTDSALPPCHYSFQIIVNRDNSFDLLWNQRSADLILGVPYNIASYALFMKLIEATFMIKPRRLIGMLGDVHIYHPHIEFAEQQLSIMTFPDFPDLKITPKAELYNYEYGDITLDNYSPLEKPNIYTPMYGGII